MQRNEITIVPALLELITASPGDRLGLLARHCARLTRMADVSVAAVAPDGTLQAGGASSAIAERLLRAELTVHQGPAADCFSNGRDIHGAPMLFGGRWAAVAAVARDRGLTTVDTLLIATDAGLSGVVCVYSRLTAGLASADQTLVAALAAVAGVAIAHAGDLARVERDSQVLHDATDRRVLVEQATGLIAGRDSVGMHDALDRLTILAREHGQELHEAADALISAHQAACRPSGEPRP